MSYIRPLCNPESLFVVGTVFELHNFSWTDPHGKSQQLDIPSDDFHEFFKRFRKWEDDDYHDLWDETFEYNGISLRTVTFHEGLKRILTDEEIEERDKIHMFDQDGRVNHLICLTYKDFSPLLMWEVTWDRLRDSAYEHLSPPPPWLLRKLNGMFHWYPRR